MEIATDKPLRRRSAARKAAPGRAAFRRPSLQDGPAVHGLVERCPPLDANSLYCNLIQCAHFAGTSVIAEINDRAAGWVSGHIPPGKPDTLFVWQVAVDPSARGLGLAKAMISEILARPECRDVTRVETTITPDNNASWRLFRSLAADLGAAIRDEPWLLADDHFGGRHATEHLVMIGPFNGAPRAH